MSGSVFDACVAGYYDGEAAEFMTTTTPIARKPHVCCECGHPICPGEKYERTTGKWDVSIDTYTTCWACSLVRNSLVRDAWTFGELWSAIHESYCRGDTPEASFCICPDGEPRRE